MEKKKKEGKAGKNQGKEKKKSPEKSNKFIQIPPEKDRHRDIRTNLTRKLF